MLTDTHDDVPKELDQLVQACLEKRPEDRPNDASTEVQTLMQIYETSLGEPYGRPEPNKIQPLADGLNNQGVSLLDLGRQQDAERRFEAALASDSQHPEASFNLGLLAWRDGRLTGDDLRLNVLARRPLLVLRR